MKTCLAKPGEIERKWVLIDAEGQILGRLAVVIANYLRGRNKPVYTPHVDTGDFVIVINAEKVVLTGDKEAKKIYQRYTGYMGGLKENTASEVRARHPTRLIQEAVKGMMPKNRLSRQQLRKLKIFAGAQHSHGAQKPEVVTL
jgi:large subunit ribosomal protein L13